MSHDCLVTLNCQKTYLECVVFCFRCVLQLSCSISWLCLSHFSVCVDHLALSNNCLPTSNGQYTLGVCFSSCFWSVSKWSHTVLQLSNGVLWLLSVSHDCVTAFLGCFPMFLGHLSILNCQWTPGVCFLIFGVFHDSYSVSLPSLSVLQLSQSVLQLSLSVSQSLVSVGGALNS